MEILKYWIKRGFPNWIYRSRKKRSRKSALVKWVQDRQQNDIITLTDASFDIFTDQGEDGIISYLLGKMKDVNPYFLDIGSGDCIKSNCADLAVHFGWKGVFIDKNERQLAIGRRFYRNNSNSGGLKFVSAEVRTDSITKLIAESGLPHDIGLMSIDIDGNDYWIWKAIEKIRPRLVVIEAKVEFGFRNLVVPDGPQNHHSSDKMYNGASVEAFRELGKQKGYILVGANKPGYNLFFVQEKESLPAATTTDILSDPGAKNSFYPESFFEQHYFESP